MNKLQTGRVLLSMLALLPVLASAEARVEKNVVVGMVSGLALVMDVHYPDNPNGLGIVHVPGSGWSRPLAYSAGQLSEAPHVGIFAPPLLQRGYTVFTLNHRATPRFQFPDPLQDVQRAVRFIRYHAADYGIDPDRIGALGGSSGGHLVSLLATLDGQGDAADTDPVNRVSAKVQAAVTRAAPTDLAAMSNSGALSLLLGTQQGRNPDGAEARIYREASPINHISRDDPPVLQIHGDADAVVPYEQSIGFEARLREYGIATELIRIPGAGHGPTFPGAVDPPDFHAAIGDWFGRHLGD